MSLEGAYGNRVTKQCSEQRVALTLIVPFADRSTSR